mmetsp:Transcript_7326/g.6482  ORF Transcript_7326/g.6482 Transcript_7326/m.6482 type:complete len:96 (+) Transcript_7326:480-767(+)
MSCILINKANATDVISKVDIDYYFMALIKAITKSVKSNLLLGYFIISATQFNQIVQTSAHLEFVSFNCCKLQFNETLNFELSKGEYKTRVIALTG